MGYHTLNGQRVWREGAKPVPYTGPASFDEAASLGYYEGALGLTNAEATIDVEPPAVTEINKVETVALYGIHDHVAGATYPARMEAASERIAGPYLVEDSGHLVQFERSGLFSGTLITYRRDLLGS